MMGELRQYLRMHQFFTLGFGTIIGVGWIIVMSSWLSDAGTLGTALAFLISGIFMVAIGLCYGKLASLYPVTGGPIVYGYHVFGGKAAFVIGWFLVLSYVGVCAFALVSTSWILEAVFPAAAGVVLYDVMGSEIRVGTLGMGLLFLGFISVVNYRNAKAISGFQSLLVYGLIAIGLLIAVSGVAKGTTDNLYPLFSGSSPGGAFSGFLAVLVTTPFFLAGFDVIPQAMGEKHQGVGEKQILQAIVASILLAVVFYIVVVLGTAALVPRDDLMRFDLPVSEAFAVSFASPLAGKIVLLCGLLGILSTWNAVFFAATRAVYALGRARLLPHALAYVCPATGTPRNAILLMAMITGIAAFAGKSVILPVVNTYSIVMSAIFCAMALAAFMLQRRGELGFQRPSAGYATTLSALLFSALMVAVALYQTATDSAQTVPTEWLLIMVWIALGGLAWALGSGRRAVMKDEERLALMCER